MQGFTTHMTLMHTYTQKGNKSGIQMSRLCTTLPPAAFPLLLLLLMLNLQQKSSRLACKPVTHPPASAPQGSCLGKSPPSRSPEQAHLAHASSDLPPPGAFKGSGQAAAAAAAPAWRFTKGLCQEKRPLFPPSPLPPPTPPRLSKLT
jgi:hypothetical protein